LNTFVGIRDANNAVGADYFGITAQEDYLSKLLMTEKDQIIFPTMADKPTWHSISCSGLKLSHDVMLVSPLDKDINKAIYEEYNKINPFDPKKYTSEYTYKREARKWFREEADEETKAIINAQAVSKLRSNPAQGVNYSVDSNNNVVPTFSGVTINRFAGYFLDEINTLLDYYSKENIKRIVSNKNARIENFHGAVKNGRMDFSGNGGKFRYLYDIPLSTHQYNFNQMMQALFELQKKIESGKVIDVSSNDELYKFVGASVLKSKDLDGFELVREFLKRLKAECFE